MYYGSKTNSYLALVQISSWSLSAHQTCGVLLHFVQLIQDAPPLRSGNPQNKSK
jgi:hypothetical protein